jgi:AraC-like DNA-binding protein
MPAEEKQPYIYNSISAFHRELGLPKPLHPLISVVNYDDIQIFPHKISTKIILNFYKISFISNTQGKVRYGQTYYDFDEGGLCFVAPHQVISGASPERSLSGLIVFFHPDLIRNHVLAKKIKEYGFFSYSVAEALHLSPKEKDIILSIVKQIEAELSSAIDPFSQDLLASQIGLLLDYSNRFYNRQFITRKTVHNELLSKLEELLTDYFDGGKVAEFGLPTVQYVSSQLHFSPDYLSDMLRVYTGRNTQQHIHNKLIEKAKELLSSSNLSAAEVAYQLGFEHPQSFNKLFKRKTDFSPLEFRKSLN